MLNNVIFQVEYLVNHVQYKDKKTIRYFFTVTEEANGFVFWRWEIEKNDYDEEAPFNKFSSVTFFSKKKKNECIIACYESYKRAIGEIDA